MQLASRPLFYWVVPLNCSENSLVLFVRFFSLGFLGPLISTSFQDLFGLFERQKQHFCSLSLKEKSEKGEKNKHGRDLPYPSRSKNTFFPQFEANIRLKRTSPWPCIDRERKNQPGAFLHKLLLRAVRVTRKRAEYCFFLFREYCFGEKNSLSLTEFCGKLGEFCKKLGEFALAHK